MPTRNVVITDHHESFIGELVASGRYRNASEVMRDALRQLQRREDLAQAKIAALRARLDEAEVEIARGNVYDYTPSLLDEIDLEEREEHGENSG